MLQPQADEERLMAEIKPGTYEILFTAEANIESRTILDGRIVEVRDMLNKRYQVDLPADDVWAGGRNLLRMVKPC